MRKEVFILIFIVIFSTLLIWLPFALKSSWFFGLSMPEKGMQTVMANYDGPNYIVIAKCWYQKDCIAENFSLSLPLEYYPAHFPGYPLTIWFLDKIFPATWAMLGSTLIFTIAAVLIFYLLTKNFWLSIFFLFLPARWWIVRSIGSPEPLFIFTILTSIYFFKKEKYWLAGIFGALAQLTKTPAILLLGAYLLFLLWKKRFYLKTIIPLFLIPLTILLVFCFYQIQTNDFLAYFHSGDNFHLVFPPFQAFISERSWLGDIWTEDIVWLYLLGAIGVIQLLKKKRHLLFSFAAIFFTATLFIAHRDVARYSLPLAPLMLISYEDFLKKKEFKIAFGAVFLGIYIYALNFILHNTAPIADWTPYL